MVRSKGEWWWLKEANDGWKWLMDVVMVVNGNAFSR